MLTSFADGKVFRAHTIDLYLKAGETFHLSLLPDLHIDSALCDIEGLRALAAERRKLPNHGVIAIGDICDLVMPPDVKRAIFNTSSTANNYFCKLPQQKARRETASIYLWMPFIFPKRGYGRPHHVLPPFSQVLPWALFRTIVTRPA